MTVPIDGVCVRGNPLTNVGFLKTKEPEMPLVTSSTTLQMPLIVMKSEIKEALREDKVRGILTCSDDYPKATHYQTIYPTVLKSVYWKYDAQFRRKIQTLADVRNNELLCNHELLDAIGDRIHSFTDRGLGEVHHE